MIGVGINYLYWYGLTEGDARQTLELTARAGANVVEYPVKVMATWSKEAREEFRRAAADKGLSIAATGGMGPAFDLSSPDAEVRRGAVALARQAVEVCRDVGSPGWCGILYARWYDKPQTPLTAEDRKVYWDRAVDSMRQVAKIAEDGGVTLAIEIVNRFEVFLLTTVAQGLDFVREVDSPAAKLLLDTFHMNVEEYDKVAALKEAIAQDKLGHFHAVEGNRQIPGLVASDMPWQALLAAVKDSGYDGVASMEPFVWAGASNAVHLATWRDLIENPGEETMVAAAAKGVAFLKEHLQ